MSTRKKILFSILASSIYYFSFMFYFYFRRLGELYIVNICDIFFNYANYMYFEDILYTLSCSVFMAIAFYKILKYIKSKLIFLLLVIFITILNFILARALQKFGSTPILDFFQYSAPIITSIVIAIIILNVTNILKRLKGNSSESK